MSIWKIWLEKLYRPLTVVLFVGVLLWMLSVSVRTSFGRDENVFIAGGQLIAREGLLPYRDFRHYHTPYLILIYAALFKFTAYYLLAARLLSALSALGVALTVAWLGFRFFVKAPAYYRYGLVWAGVLLLVATPLYVFTGGYAWNHNLATLFALLAFALLWRSASATHPGRWLLGAGLLLGLSLGTRVSFVTALPAFVAALAFHPQGGRRKIVQYTACFGLGMLLALLPVVFFYLMAPAGFIYDNWTYHLLNTQFRVEAAYDSPIALGDRLFYALNDVFGRQGNLLLLTGFLFAAVAMMVGTVQRKFANLFEPVLILGTPFFVAIGSFLPSPSWYQYFYAPVPFMLCGVLYGLSRVTLAGERSSRWLAALFCTAALVANLFQLQEYRRMTFLLSPASWRPVQAHQAGEKIRALIPDGKVLTLTPVFVLDGGLSIYPEFATGPFVWRVAYLMTAEQRQQVNAISSSELETFLANDPPQGILVGAGGEVEAPLAAYARQHAYRPASINDELTLWIAPK